MGDKPPPHSSIKFHSKGGASLYLFSYSSIMPNQRLGLIHTLPLCPLHHQERITLMHSHVHFLISFHIRKKLSFWTNFCIKICKIAQCVGTLLIWALYARFDMVPEVRNEGGGCLFPDHNNHVSSPRSNQPQKVG